jgi:Tudor domain
MSMADTSPLKKGVVVERNIDGEWFKATIQSIDEETKLYSIKYSDDGNIEDEVASEDLRLSVAIENPLSFLSIFSFVKKCTLPKPLAGLVEDDSDARNLQQTTVTVHTDTNTDHAVIINGTADRIAVGGGLRALRYLKN